MTLAEKLEAALRLTGGGSLAITRPNDTPQPSGYSVAAWWESGPRAHGETIDEAVDAYLGSLREAALKSIERLEAEAAKYAKAAEEQRAAAEKIPA